MKFSELHRTSYRNETFNGPSLLLSPNFHKLVPVLHLYITDSYFFLLSEPPPNTIEMGFHYTLQGTSKI